MSAGVAPTVADATPSVTVKVAPVAVTDLTFLSAAVASIVITSFAASVAPLSIALLPFLTVKPVNVFAHVIVFAAGVTGV